MKDKLMKVKAEFKTFVQSKLAKSTAVASAVVAGMSVAAHAEGETTVDFSPVTTALSSAVTVTQVLTLVGTIVGVGAVFFFAWFGARKLVAAFQAALKNGKIKI